MEIRIGDTVRVIERDYDALGRTSSRAYRGVVIGVHKRRRWVLVAYRAGQACLRGGFAIENVRVLEDEK